jgi:hypothetical protein
MSDHSDAIMGIMLMLPTDQLPNLRKDFDASPDGLNLHEFIRAMMKRLPLTTTDLDSLVSDLRELFEQVDVNGDGMMHWDEFTSFVIEAGMVSSKSTASLEQKYMERTNFVSHSHQPQRLRYFAELKQLAVCEGENNMVKFYDPYEFKHDGGECSMTLLQVNTRLSTMHLGSLSYTTLAPWYTFTPSHLHTFTPSHLHTFTPPQASTSLHTSKPPHLHTSTPPHLHTFTPSHLVLEFRIFFYGKPFLLVLSVHTYRY